MKYCEKKLQVDKKVISETNRKHVTTREFIFINCGNVDRERPGVKPVQGTRQFHSARSCGQEMVIEAKHLNCYCVGCKEGLCQNVEYVSAWEKKRLSVNTEMIPDTTGRNTCTTTSSLSPDISVEDFAKVKLSAGRGYNIYMAEVLEPEEDGKEAHLKYMKKCSGDLYMRPNPIDKSWEPTANII